MGHRTLSLSLVLRALFLDIGAFDALRDDDNPAVEGGFLVVVVCSAAALLSLVGQLVAWASTPSVAARREVVLQVLQHQPWWPSLAGNPAALDEFNRWWDLGWRFLPPLLGAPDPARAALNIVVWPVLGLLDWLFYGLLAFAFARGLRGAGTLNQTLGATALAIMPFLLRGLGLIPFLTIGSVLAVWQLICRYHAIRSVHRLSWQRSVWTTILPLVIYLLAGLLLVAIGSAAFGALVRGG